MEQLGKVPKQVSYHGLAGTCYIRHALAYVTGMPRGGWGMQQEEESRPKPGG